MCNVLAGCRVYMKEEPSPHGYTSLPVAPWPSRASSLTGASPHPSLPASDVSPHPTSSSPHLVIALAVGCRRLRPTRTYRRVSSLQQRPHPPNGIVGFQ